MSIDNVIRYAADLRTLRRRGLSPIFLRELADAGAAATPQVTLLIKLTASPPPRSRLKHLAMRVWVAFGGTDPDDARRAEMAKRIGQINGHLATTKTRPARPDFGQTDRSLPRE